VSVSGAEEGSLAVAAGAAQEKLATVPDDGADPGELLLAVDQFAQPQLAVDAAHQIIVAEEVLQAASDKGRPVPMVEAVYVDVGEVPEAAGADAGLPGRRGSLERAVAAA
jgi:hypothetical protein